MIEVVVFDMAGTTVNENNLVYKTLHKCINNAGYSFTFEEVIWQGAGKEKHQAIKDILKSKFGTEIQIESISDDIYEAFSIELEKQYQTAPIKAFESSKVLFPHLREQNIAIVLNTGYNRKIAELILERLNWTVGKEIDLLVTADEVQNGRPGPEMIHYAMDHLNVKESQKIAKIGDSVIDIEEGRSAECGLVIGVTTGAHNANQLQEGKPDFIIDSLEEIKAILQKMQFESF